MNNGSGKSSILKRPLSVNSAARVFNSPEAQSERTQTVMWWLSCAISSVNPRLPDFISPSRFLPSFRGVRYRGRIHQTRHDRQAETVDPKPYDSERLTSATLSPFHTSTPTPTFTGIRSIYPPFNCPCLTSKELIVYSSSDYRSHDLSASPPRSDQAPPSHLLPS